MQSSCSLCGCSNFDSNFLCLICDKHWEEHETVFETREERVAMGFPVGGDFIPLSEVPGLQKEVFGGSGSGGGAPEALLESGAISAQEYHEMIKGMDSLVVGASASSASNSAVGMRVQLSALRKNPNQVKGRRAEKSVRLSHVTSGGTKKGKVVNRWGKTETE